MSGQPTLDLRLKNVRADEIYGEGKYVCWGPWLLRECRTAVGARLVAYLIDRRSWWWLATGVRDPAPVPSEREVEEHEPVASERPAPR